MVLESIIREEEGKHFSDITLQGKVLDLGGTHTSSYLKMAKGSFSVTTVNFVENNSNIVHDLEITPYPIPDKSYDVVVCNNTLEHVYHARELVSETGRILKKGGRIIISVPFLFPYHASPHDYWRYTPEAVQKMLEDAEYNNIKILPLGTGVLSVNFSNLERLLPVFLRKATHFAHPLVRFGDKFITWCAGGIGKKYNPQDYALGFFVVAHK